MTQIPTPFDLYTSRLRLTADEIRARLLVEHAIGARTWWGKQNVKDLEMALREMEAAGTGTIEVMIWRRMEDVG